MNFKKWIVKGFLWAAPKVAEAVAKELRSRNRKKADPKAGPDDPTGPMPWAKVDK